MFLSSTETFCPASVKVEPETNSPYLQCLGLVDLNDLKEFEFPSDPVEVSHLQPSQPVDLTELVDLESLPVETVVDTETYNLVSNVNGVS